MATLSEQLEALYNEWLDNIEKEIDRLKMDNITKAKEILTLRNMIRENEYGLNAIKLQLHMTPYEMPDIEKEIDNACDYAAYIVDMVNKIEDYNSDKDEKDDEDDDEDEEPAAYCDNCGTVIWNVHKIMQGYKGKYCCDECRKEAEDEDDDEA